MDILAKKVEIPVSSEQSQGWNPCKQVEENTWQGGEELPAKNSNSTHLVGPTTAVAVRISCNRN